MKRFIGLLLVFILGAGVANAMPLTEDQKIKALLSTLDNPGVVFIRNGERHDGAWGKKHLIEKWKGMKEEVKTADDFITKVATSSSQTGRPYQIEAKNGKVKDAAAWFRFHLNDMNTRFK